MFIFDLPSHADSSLYVSLNNLAMQYSKKSSRISCLDLILNDFQAKYQLKSFMSEYIRFMGPTTVKFNSSLSLADSELFCTTTIGSLCFTINKQFIKFLTNLIEVNQSSKSSAALVKREEPRLKSYEDDLRNSEFKYKIIDTNYLKTKAQSDFMGHIKLPDTNEIVCVDDLNLDGAYASTVTWRYAQRRALTSLVINPLPFIGQQETNKLECYLEYFNECLKRFICFKVFYLSEGVYIHVLDRDTNIKLVYSSVWRIRFSNETRKLVYASSLLASTRVDSLAQETSKFHAHLEGSIANLEVKLNRFIQTSDLKSSDTADLACLSLNEFGVRLITQASQMDLIAYGQLGVEFCEYRFLTMQSLIDSFQFKFLMNQQKVNNKLDLNVQIENLNLLISESSLLALKQIESDLTQSSSSTNLEYYTIYNDTNVNLNVKQFDTEETCLIRAGECVPYSWRTHKKKQLMQMFISKYKQNSAPFQLNESGVQEIRFNLVDNQSSVFLVKIKDEHAKKIIRIESKLVVCNYLDLDVQNLSLNYSNNEIRMSSINKMCRSSTTYELVESINFKLNSLEINGKKILFEPELALEDQLKTGLVCHDVDLDLKYWINLNEIILCDDKKCSQWCLILSPVFVFCSYLPYDLNIQLSGNQTSLIRSNSASHLFPQKSLSERELAIKFDHLSVASSSAAESVWFDQSVVWLNEKHFKPFDCEDHLACE